MSSPRVQKYFQAMPEQIKRAGKYSYNFQTVLRWSSRIPSGPYAGKDACLIDIDSATWADNNRRVIIVAEPASDLNGTAALKTQSHAAGHYIDGSVYFKAYFESPESWTSDQAQFVFHVLHHLRGQLASPVELFFGTNDVQPRVEGVDGASAANETACSFVSAGWMIPGLWPAPGGI